MSNHKIALVPLSTGYFQSPELLSKGVRTDLGLFAEALIYYDSVYVHVDNPEQFADFINRLIKHGLSYKKLLELTDDGTLRFFNTGLIMPYMGTGNPDIITSLYFIRESGMDKPGYFAKRYLEFGGLRSKFLNSLDFEKFCQNTEKTAVSFIDEELGGDSVKNAYNDFFNLKRYKLIVKYILEELYKVNNLGDLPEFDIKVRELNSKNLDEIAKNINSTILGLQSDDDEYKIYEIDYTNLIKPIPSLEDKNKTALFSHIPIVCAGVSNLYIKSAEKLNCDLFLPSPVSRVIGNKLYESSNVEISKLRLDIQNLIENLQIQTEFPDIKYYVNSNQIRFDKVLEIRKKAKFQEWLKNDAVKDTNALIASHNEVTKDAGLINAEKHKILKLFGVLGAVHFSLFENEIYPKDAENKLILAENKSGLFLESVGEKLLSSWNPICFGEWYKDEIATVLKQQDDMPRF